MGELCSPGLCSLLCCTLLSGPRFLHLSCVYCSLHTWLRFARCEEARSQVQRAHVDSLLAISCMHSMCWLRGRGWAPWSHCGAPLTWGLCIWLGEPV